MNLIEIVHKVLESQVEKAVLKAIIDISNRSLFVGIYEPVPKEKITLILFIIHRVPRISKFDDTLTPMIIMKLLRRNLA